MYEFNKLTTTLKKEQQFIDPYPWLAEEDERRNLIDKEILEKYIDFETLCLTQKENKKLMDMLYRYKDAISLRDEIGTCPNIEVEIEVVDKDTIFHQTISCEGGKRDHGQRNEVTVSSGYIKRFFSILQSSYVNK